MKKAISILLALVMTLGLCACGKNNVEVNSESNGANKNDYIGVWQLRDNGFMYVYEDGTGDYYSAKYDAWGNLDGEHYNVFTWELEGDYFVKTTPDGQVYKYKLSDDKLLDKQGNVYVTKHSNETSVDVHATNR